MGYFALKTKLNIQKVKTSLQSKNTQRKGLILVVDDEPINLDGLEAALEDDYELLRAGSGPEALAIDRLSEVDLVISDQRMPEMLGTELLTILAERYPKQQRILLTGYTDVTDLIECINAGLLNRYLAKPWMPKELKLVISQCFDQQDMIRKVDQQSDMLRIEVEERRRAQLSLEEALVQLRETQHTLIAQEKLRALGELTSGVAHDFNNLLTPIKAYCEELIAEQRGEVELLPDEREEALQCILNAVEDGVMLIERLKGDHHPDHVPSDRSSHFNVKSLLNSALHLALPRWSKRRSAKGLSTEVVYFQLLPEVNDLAQVPQRDKDLGVYSYADEHLHAFGVPSELRQAIVNLLNNALDALEQVSESRSEYCPMLYLSARMEKSEVLIQIRDNGPGMSTQVLARCQDPFYSTKASQGSGLGLAMVRQTVDRHRGRISISSVLGQGTTVQFTIPCSMS